MDLQSQSELESTRKKLRLLEERYEARSREENDASHTRQLTMRSLKSPDQSAERGDCSV